MSAPILLSDRALLAVSGEERFSFLNTLLSADVSSALGEARYAALLTPQGKLLADVICLTDEDRIIVEFPTDSEFAKRLRMYKLRAAVTLEPLDDWQVLVQLTDPAPSGCLSFADPRNAGLGHRLYSPAGQFSPDHDRSAYDAARLMAVVPEGPVDLEPNKALLLESGFERLGGVDFRKGCFVGQEVFARIRTYGKTNRILAAIEIESPSGKSLLGTQLEMDGNSKGVVTSETFSKIRHLVLGYVPTPLKQLGQRLKSVMQSVKLLPDLSLFDPSRLKSQLPVFP